MTVSSCTSSQRREFVCLLCSAALVACILLFKCDGVLDRNTNDRTESNNRADVDDAEARLERRLRNEERAARLLLESRRSTTGNRSTWERLLPSPVRIMDAINGAVYTVRADKSLLQFLGKSASKKQNDASTATSSGDDFLKADITTGTALPDRRYFKSDWRGQGWKWKKRVVFMMFQPTPVAFVASGLVSCLLLLAWCIMNKC
eukprot:scpid87339/ scgid21213/ 